MNKYLFVDINRYQNKKLASTAHKIKRNKMLNIFLNILIVVSALAAASLTTLIISKQIYSSYPSWYFLVTAGISAGTTAIATLLSFFYVKENYKKHKANLKKIEAEIVLYDNKLLDKYSSSRRDYELFLSIESILGSKEAEKEAEDE